MVREVGVHYYYEGACCVFQAMDVGGSETQFAGAGFYDDALGPCRRFGVVGRLLMCRPGSHRRRLLVPSLGC